MSTPILTVEEVQEHIRDASENNHLIDGQEFSPTVINIAIKLAISEWNTIPPLSVASLESFPMGAKSVLMNGTLWKLFAGQAALLARNTMNYSDGGLQVPVEERFPLYIQMAAMYEQSFMNAAQRLKIHLNMEDGWGGVMSDESLFPIW
jgi:hypothetical protein